MSCYPTLMLTLDMIIFCNIENTIFHIWLYNGKRDWKESYRYVSMSVKTHAIIFKCMNAVPAANIE